MSLKIRVLGITLFAALALAGGYIFFVHEPPPTKPAPPGSPENPISLTIEAPPVLAEARISGAVLAPESKPKSIPITIDKLVKVDPKTLSGAIKGQVVDAESGAPVAGAQVWIDGGRTRLKTDEDGRFKLEGKPMSTAIVVARAPGYKHASKQVRVGLSKPLELKLEPSPVGRIKGQVEFRGEPPETFTIFLGLEPHRFPSADGRFVLDPVNVGYHKLSLGGTGAAAKLPLNTQSIEVKEGETTTVEFILQPQVKVAGRVVNEAGEPLVFAKLLFNRIIVVSQRDGTFTTDILPAGSYRVTINHSDYGRSDGGLVTLVADEPQTDLEFVVRPKGQARLEGRVLEAGEPVEKTRVVLKKEVEKNPNPLLQRFPAGSLRPLRIVETDEDGRYQVRNLAAGAYVLEVTLKGKPMQREIEVADGEVLEVDFAGD